MKFNPTYMSSDNLFEIEIEDISKITNERKPQTEYMSGLTDSNATLHKLNVYNTFSKSYSTKQTYVDKKGKVFFRGKKSHKFPERKYYMEDLIKI